MLASSVLEFGANERKRYFGRLNLVISDERGVLRTDFIFLDIYADHQLDVVWIQRDERCKNGLFGFFLNHKDSRSVIVVLYASRFWRCL